MEVVNPSPVLRKRPSGSESRQTGKSQAAIRKVEASTRRRRHERAVLELASQRFELPIGKMHFSKTEVLSVGKCLLIMDELRSLLSEPSARIPHYYRWSGRGGGQLDQY